MSPMIMGYFREHETIFAEEIDSIAHRNINLKNSILLNYFSSTNDSETVNTLTEKYMNPVGLQSKET